MLLERKWIELLRGPKRRFIIEKTVHVEGSWKLLNKNTKNNLVRTTLAIFYVCNAAVISGKMKRNKRTVPSFESEGLAVRTEMPSYYNLGLLLVRLVLLLTRTEISQVYRVHRRKTSSERTIA